MWTAGKDDVGWQQVLDCWLGRAEGEALEAAEASLLGEGSGGERGSELERVAMRDLSKLEGLRLPLPPGAVDPA